MWIEAVVSNNVLARDDCNYNNIIYTLHTRLRSFFPGVISDHTASLPIIDAYYWAGVGA